MPFCFVFISLNSRKLKNKSHHIVDNTAKSRKQNALTLQKQINWIIMQTITVQSEAYREFMEKFERFQKRVEQIALENRYIDKERWLDNQDLCQILHISKRTLQYYRDNGIIPFAQIGAKVYYKASDVEKMLLDNYRPAFK